MSKSFQGNEYLPVPTTTAGPIALETTASPVKNDHRIKKLVGFALVALLFLVAGKVGSDFVVRESSKGLWSGEHAHGWRGHHLEHGVHAAGAGVESYLSLPTTAAVLSIGGDLTLDVPAHSKSIVVHLDDASVDAQLSFVNNVDLPKGTAAQILVEKVVKGEVVVASTPEEAIKVIDGANEGVVGLVFAASSIPTSYLITISLSSRKERGPPVSLVAHGASLTLPSSVDLEGFKFDRFSLSPAAEHTISIKNLHANKGKIVLAGGGSIVGSFNVSEALILKTEVGDVFANVSIHAPHHKSHKHNKDASWSKKMEDVEARHAHHHSHDGSSAAATGEEPHHGHPAHGPSRLGEFKVIVKNTIGEINLQFVDEKISKFTQLHAKAFSEIAGSIQIGVLPGFKGFFLEKSQDGVLCYEHPSNTEIKIVKNIIDGPGGLVKGLVGPHPAWNLTGVAHQEIETEKNGLQHQHREHHHHKEDASVSTSEHSHHHSHHQKGEELASDSAHPHHHHSHGEEVASTSTSESKHHHHHDDANLNEKHDGPPSDHTGPHPGYGFVGGFAGAGKVDIVFL